MCCRAEKIARNVYLCSGFARRSPHVGQICVFVCWHTNLFVLVNFVAPLEKIVRKNVNCVYGMFWAYIKCVYILCVVFMGCYVFTQIVGT